MYLLFKMVIFPANHLSFLEGFFWRNVWWHLPLFEVKDIRETLKVFWISAMFRGPCEWLNLRASPSLRSLMSRSVSEPTKNPTYKRTVLDIAFWRITTLSYPNLSDSKSSSPNSSGLHTPPVSSSLFHPWLVVFWTWPCCVLPSGPSDTPHPSLLVWMTSVVTWMIWPQDLLGETWKNLYVW